MFAKTCRKNLLAIARAYAKGWGITLGAVSREIYGKSNFLDDFGAGRGSMSVKNFDNALKTLAGNWPPKTDWPFLPAITFEGPISVHKGKIPRKG